MGEITENQPEHQSVEADAWREVIKARVQGDEKDIRKLIETSIAHAFTLSRLTEDAEIKWETIYKELNKLDLKNKQFDELIVMMSYYQGKIGAMPMQRIFERAKTFNRVRGQLRGF